MRTAIFVYQPTLINITTSESGLQLLGMEAETTTLCAGNNAQTIPPGIYKIDSSYTLQISGDNTVFDIVTSSGKENDPTPPLRASSSFAAVDGSELNAFLTSPNAKVLENP